MSEVTQAEVRFGGQQASAGAGRRARIFIVVSSGFPQEDFDALSAAEPRAELIAATDETVYERAVDIDAMIGCPRDLFSAELLARAGRTLS